MDTNKQIEILRALRNASAGEPSAGIVGARTAAVASFYSFQPKEVKHDDGPKS